MFNYQSWQHSETTSETLLIRYYAQLKCYDIRSKHELIFVVCRYAIDPVVIAIVINEILSLSEPFLNIRLFLINTKRRIKNTKCNSFVNFKTVNNYQYCRS